MEFAIKLTKKQLFVIILSTIVFFSCSEIRYFSHLNSIYSRILLVFRIFLILLFFMQIIINKSTNLLRVFNISMFLVFVIFLSTIFNSGNITTFVREFTPIILICMMLETYKDDKESIYLILNIWKWFMIFLVFIDFATELFFPNGLYATDLYRNNWFLGYKTERLIYIFPMLLIYGYLSIKKNKQKMGIFFYILVLISLLDCYISEGMACIISLAIFLGLYILLSFLSGKGTNLSQKIAYRIMDYRICILAYLAVFFLIVIFQNSQIIIYFTSIFNKSNTVSGRSLIWTSILSYIRNNLVFGVGCLTSSQYVSLANMRTATNAHNAVLTLLVDGGIVAIALYFSIIIMSIRRTEKKYNKAEYLMIAGIYSILITGITSSIMVFSVFGLLCFWLMEYEKDQANKLKYI